MNIDIVSSGRPDDLEKNVNYGEPSPAAVYKAAFGIEPGASADLPLIQSIIEQMEDKYWAIFSIEFGCAEQPASFWQCSTDIGELSTHELHLEYERGLEIVRSEYYKASVGQLVPNG